MTIIVIKLVSMGTINLHAATADARTKNTGKILKQTALMVKGQGQIFQLLLSLKNNVRCITM